MTFPKQTVKDVDVQGKKILLRTMLNVPIKDGVVSDTMRLQAALPTIQYLLDQNAALVLISHHSTEGQTLAPAAKSLSDLLGQEVQFATDCIGNEVESAVAGLQAGQVLMLENLRFHPEEEANDPEFAKTLASYGELFVQDDFTTCHRKHASMVGVPQYLPAVAGLEVALEVETIDAAIDEPKRPLVAVSGGAKVSTKVPILSFLLGKVDSLFIGGAMANTFLLAKGLPIGKSLVEADQVELCKKILAEAETQGKTVVLPVDVVVAKSVDPPSDVRTVSVNDVADDDIIADIGAQSVAQLDSVLSADGTIIWNGPVGIFETPEFASGTAGVADKIIASGGYSVIGGGDTCDYVDNAHLHDKFSFVSTGGGASLELMSGNTLPGVEALLDKK
ncbi:MAG TPA: phosphoglycerate kinase [Candidatus Saccharimonadales bacterium]|nr:phosphoglycerate kinase [Candidatus Saccharimonadales bacterium]